MCKLEIVTFIFSKYKLYLHDDFTSAVKAFIYFDRKDFILKFWTQSVFICILIKK